MYMYIYIYIYICIYPVGNSYLGSAATQSVGESREINPGNPGKPHWDRGDLIQ